MAGLAEEDLALYNNYARAAGIFLDKFERYESQELLSHTTAHWLLGSDLYRTSTEPVNVLDEDTFAQTTRAVILFPTPTKSDVSPFCYRELHNIIRELTMGMFVLNQTPSITLDASFDQATVCNIPPAYIDTYTGQLLTNVDYMLKGLWHGAYFPKEKRLKFSERWRGNLDVNQLGKPETKKPLLGEFLAAGLLDVTKDPDFTNVYDQLPFDIPGDEEMLTERVFFMSYVENLNMQLTFCPEDMKNYRNMFVFDSRYFVSSIVRMLDNQIDFKGYERLKTRLQMHENLIQEHLAAKKEIYRQLELLKFVSCLIPFFLLLRRSAKIPDIQKLLQPYSTEECRTEKEFPPLIVGPEFKCKNFVYSSQYFHLHGGINFDVEADRVVEASQEFSGEHQHVTVVAEKELEAHLNNLDHAKEYFAVPVYTIAGKSYYAIAIELESYSGSSPQRPLWVRAYGDEIDKLKPKRLPISDLHIHEQFKRIFGFKKAIKLKTPLVGIKLCAQRGFVTIFTALSRKVTGARLFKHDEQGLSLLHYAAIHNRPQVLTRMLMNPVDVNMRRNNALATEYKKAISILGPSGSSDVMLPKLAKSTSQKHTEVPTGPTSLHMAARCGSLDVVSCLWSRSANCYAIDQDGWAPIHYAAYFDQQGIVQFMARKNPDLLEMKTNNELISNPLLLAASGGAISVVKCLIGLEVNIDVKDAEDNNVVTLAALRFHTNVLQYLIELQNPAIPVWNILVEMLSDEVITRKDSGIKCLEVLSTSHPNHWKCIRDAGGIPAIVELLKIDNDELQSMASSVLCNMSEHPSVRQALTRAKEAIPVLIHLLSSPIKDVLSRATIILADIARLEDNQTQIAEHGGIAPIVALLDSNQEEVLINAVNVIRVLCIDHIKNQNAVAECGGLDPLVELLEVPSDDLQAGTAAALAAATFKNKDNQNYVISKNAHKPLVDLIKNSKSTIVQVKAAKTLEALATNNYNSQMRFLELDAPKALIRLLKNVNVQVREQGACSLWSLSGDTRTQQKYIAERISIPHITQMLLEPTEKLLYVGCMNAVALAMEDMANQNRLASVDAIPQLVSLLRSPRTSQKVLHMVIKVIGVLCVGVAYRNNKVTQTMIAEEGGISLLAGLFQTSQMEEIKVEVAIALGCVTLSFKENQQKLADDQRFSFDALPQLLKIKVQDTRLKVGMALTLFCFNNTERQIVLREAAVIKYSLFRKFLESADEFYQCYAAFQMVVLSGAVIDKDQITLTAQGIELLVSKILSHDDKVVVLACNLLSALAHTRAGLSDAMVSIGILDLLVDKLSSNNVMVRNSCAVALGCLTFNKTAYRLLFSVCRNIPGLFQKIMNNIGEYPRINEEFISDFKKAKADGLPCHFLAGNMSSVELSNIDNTKKKDKKWELNLQNL